MAEPNQIFGDMRITGQLIVGSITLPNSCITDINVASNAAIGATKLEHQYPLHHVQATGTAVVSRSENLHVVRGTTGLLIGVEAMVDTAPTGADRTISINVLKGSQSTGFATLLTTPLVINNTHVARQVLAASLAAVLTLADGDTIRVEVTVAGAAGAQGQGLNVTVFVRELANA